ncbi:hypothetical protein [Natronorubrum sp. DTA28]|uniref:hypothetical protein n=1 Tax=Natronorubrum sp. DTA28 TaxID=3447019 RepID=UPI003F861B4A
MSELPSNIERQKRKGIVLLAGAVLIFGGGMLVFQYYDLPPVSYLGLLVPVGILGFFGYRAVSATRDRNALQDERTTELHGKVSLNSFWWLINIIFVDAVFGFFPEEGSSILYVFIGLAIYGLYFGYYRYIE